MKLTLLGTRSVKNFISSEPRMMCLFKCPQQILWKKESQVRIYLGAPVTVEEGSLCLYPKGFIPKTLKMTSIQFLLTVMYMTIREILANLRSLIVQ